MTGWLSTWRVALPPLRVKRTTWYLPSFTMTAGSSIVMSSVPTLKITPIFPWSCRWRTKKKKESKLHNCQSCTFYILHIIFTLNIQTIEFPSNSYLSSQRPCWNSERTSFVSWTVCLVLSVPFSVGNSQLRLLDVDHSWQNPAASLLVDKLLSLSASACSCQPYSKIKSDSQASLWVALIRTIGNKLCVVSLPVWHLYIQCFFF